MPAAGGTPGIGVKIDVDDTDAEKKAKRHEKRMRDLEAAHQRLANRVKSSNEKAAKSAQQSYSKRMKWMMRMRRQISTLIFHYRFLLRIVQSTWRLMAEAAESNAEKMGIRALARSYEVDLGLIAEQMREFNANTLSVGESMQVVQSGMIKDQGEFVTSYAELWKAARVAAVTGGGEAIDIFDAMVEGLVEGSGKIVDSATSIFHMEYALQQYAQATGQSVDEIDRLEAAQVILNTIMQRSNQLLDEGADAALKNREEFEKTSATWKDIKDVIGAMATDPEGLTLASQLLETILQLVVTLGAHVSVIFQFMRKDIQETAEALADLASFDPARVVAGMQRLQMGLLPEPGEYGERLERTRERALEALGLFRDEVEPERMRPFPRAVEEADINLDPIIDHILKREDLIEQHTYRLEKIDRDHNQRLVDIGIRHEQRVARLQRQATRDRSKAWRKYHNRVLNETIEFNMKMQQNQERHDLEMLYNQRKFNMGRLQDLALYEYERGLLVAEGDVLAIEDLDARFTLEQNAKRDNFGLSQRKEEDDFQLRQTHRREQFQEELRQLRAALDEQLLEISIRLNDQLIEADERRKEDIRRANVDHQQRLDDEQHMHDRSLEQWAQYWTKVAKQVKIGADAMTAILEDYYGPGGIADTIITTYTSRHQFRESTRGQIERVLSSQEWEAMSPAMRTWMEGRSPYGSPALPGLQYGGEGVVSRPSLLPVGEGNRPERYSVQPLYPSSGNLTLSWQGGPIPVQGSGGMAGADLSGMGDAIAQGLITEMTKQFDQRRG